MTDRSRPALSTDSDLDWSAIGDEALERLRDYLRRPTVNDPAGATADEPWRTADESAAVGWLSEWLAAEGVDHEVVEAAPGRASLLATVSGGSHRDAPLLLLSHSDVVPAVRAEWDVDPFAATIRDGFLYGRGALDIKGLGIAQLMSLVLLRRQGVPVQRDVIALVAADEEAGGEFGAHWLVGERPDLLRAGTVLGEGSYSPTGVVSGNGVLHAVSVAEKGYLEIEVTATGPAHHSSMPDSDDAPARLIRALNRVLDRSVTVRMTDATERLCGILAENASGLHRTLLRRPRLMARLGPRVLPASTLVASMFTETCAVTVLSGGYKTNVIPGEARAVLSLRLLPGSTPEDAVERIRRAVDDPQVHLHQGLCKAPNASPFDTVGYDVLTRTIGASSGPADRIAPIPSPAASDARHWRAAGSPGYGWVPFVVPVGDIHGVHGPNERLSIDAFTAGMRLYYRAVSALATAPEPLERRAPTR